MGKSSPHGTVRRCACAFHGSSVRKVRNIFRASRLRIPSKISAKDGAQSILKKATPGTWEYDAVPLISCFTESSCSSEICKSRVVASLDRKRLGQTLGASGISIRGVFDEETRRKPLAFAADAVRYGI